MKNQNLTLLDRDQVTILEHDQANDAKRVIIVGGDGAQIAESIKESLKDIKVDFKLDEEKIRGLLNEFKPAPAVLPEHTIVPVEHTKIEKIEVPVIIKETEFQVIEKPIVVKEVELKIIEIEKPVFIYQPSETLLIKCLLVIQVAASITLGLLHFFNK